MRALVITKSITNRDEQSLEKYFTEISKYEILTPDEELSLFTTYQAGDENALSKIVLHNLRFVVSVAKHYPHTGFKLGDLINEGNIGLITAARRFDPSKGFKFISYAVWWIRQSILQALTEKSRKIRVPSNHHIINLKLSKASTKFIQEKEREPTLEELAEKTGLAESMIKSNLKYRVKYSSLDAPVEENGQNTIGNFLEDQKINKPDFDLEITETQKKNVKMLMEYLPAREAAVLTLYFGIDRNFPMSLSDIGEQFGITRERVRQIKDRSLVRLRSRFRNMASVFGPEN